jgi:predicted alpha/beta hydrolase family esterase
MKHQIVVIHGGDTFDTYKEYIAFLKSWRIDFKGYLGGKNDWKRNLGKTLGKNYEVILLDMPNKINAKYLEWKIWFQKFVPHIRPNAIFIGHSLGGIFLVKYLSENNFPKKISAVFLVAAPYDENDTNDSLADFKLTKSLDKFRKQAGKIFIYHSKDDPVVPFVDSEKYAKSLKNSVRRTFANRGHFRRENLPELVKDIKKAAYQT